MMPFILTLMASAPALELTEVVQSTTRHHPLVLSALTDVAAAKAETLASQGAFDPNLRARGAVIPWGGYPSQRLDAWVDAPTPLWGAQASAGYRLGRGDFPVYYGERETDDWGELRAGLSIPLLRNGPIDRRRANIERAALGQKLAQLSVEQQRLELRRQAALRWVRWVAAGERKALAQALLQLAKTRQSQLDERVRSGDLPQVDALDNQRAIVQREALMVQAQRALEEATFELSLFYRDDEGAPVTVDASRLPKGLTAPDDAPMGVAVEEALLRRPEVGRLKLQTEQADIEVRLARNQLLPGVDVSGFVSKDIGPSKDLKRSMVEAEFSVMLEIPLFYRQLFGRLDAATAAKRKLDFQLQLQRERVQVEITDATSAARAARERARLMMQEVQFSKTLEEGERQRLALGDSTLFLLNLRESATFEAALREVDVRADWHRASADLAAALAMP